MTLKQYNIVRMTIVIALAVFVSQSVILHNYIIPLVTAAVAALMLFYFRGRVRDVVADERDYEISGKASRLAVQIYSWIALALFFLISALRGGDAVWVAVAYSLAFSACLVMSVYAIAFRLMAGQFNMKKKWMSLALAVGFLVALALVGYLAVENRFVVGSPSVDNQISR